MSDIDMLRSAVDSIPEPGDQGSLGMNIATEPARIFMRMIKGTLHSVINLSEQTRTSPAEQEAYFANGGALDVLNVIGGGAGFAERGAVGTFGGRLLEKPYVRDVRGNRLWEMDDSAMKLKAGFPKAPNEGAIRLEDAIDYPELFKVYPELKDVTVRRTPSGWAYSEPPGGYTPRRADERVGTGAVLQGHEGHIAIGETDDIAGTARTLIHEIQHAVQDQDIAKGISRSPGANPNEIMEEGTIALTRLGNILQKNPAGLTDQQLTVLQRLNESTYKALGYSREDAWYMRNPGEIEAQTATNRLRWSEAERQANPPDLSSGVAGSAIDITKALETSDPSDAIPKVGFGRRGTAASTGRPIVTTEDIPGVRGPSLLAAADVKTAADFQKYIAQTGGKPPPGLNLDTTGLLDFSSIQREAARRVQATGGELPPDAFDALK